MYLRDPIYLSGSSGKRGRRASPLGRVANLLFIILVVGANYYVFFHDDDVQAPVIDRAQERDLMPEELDQPTPPAETPTQPDGDQDGSGSAVVRNFEGRLQKGDTVFRALSNHGLEDHSVAPVLAAMKDVFDFRKAQVGHKYTGELDGRGRIVRFEYQTGAIDIYTVDRVEDGYSAKKKNIPVDMRVAEIGCMVGSSLFASLTRCGESPELARAFTDLFAFDVDFFQEIRRGDVLRMIVEKVYVNGRFLKYGKLRAAEYEGKFGKYAAFLYKDENGREEYFTQDGRALRKEFLKTPLKYTRISSGYTKRRFHPTLHKWKSHLAIDYAAATNTPVQAIASGQVKYVGFKGASGNLVVIEHGGGYTSYYAHLNKFGNVEVGDQVSQRTLIGYVGKTGRATGPHLHFALKHKKKWVNPLKVKYTTANPVLDSERGRFDSAIRPLLIKLKQVAVLGLNERQG
ncbi:MAG: murein DD-endopeptidase MepM/ murein hydrolase activator NlpD [Myxococcota bacterium]|jgi:murein DD-endopeptidase MepM/ murein hydrolase activator NlpD